jgi:hypothetical protein
MFSFFRKKPSDRRRFHHYAFAYKALPPIFFENPLPVLGILASPKGEGLLRDIWEDVGKAAKKVGRADGGGHVKPKGLACVEKLRAGDWAVAVVALPEPMAQPEAWFVALACKIPDPEALQGNGDEMPKPEARCYTLEMAWDDDQKNIKSFLCAWFPDGGRANYGEGPEPSAEAFAAAVAAHLEGEGPGPTAEFHPAPPKDA